VTGSAGLGDDSLEFVDLGLGTAESTEPLLGQLARALVLAVAQQFNDAALVRGEAVGIGRVSTEDSKFGIRATPKPPTG
jgi:hypothetical protein